MNYPILYSLQHCPYAMRARMGIILSQQIVELRAIALKNKPTEMLKASAKGTVPVLVIENGKVIDESLDIMLWALNKNDPLDLLAQQPPTMLSEMMTLIGLFDSEFKSYLEKYKSAKRYHDSNQLEFRHACEEYINQLEHNLNQHQFVMGERLSLADYAILPYIRQFSRVEKEWFRSGPYVKLKYWLKSHIESRVFSKVMAKHPLWLDNHQVVLFGMEK